MKKVSRMYKGFKVLNTKTKQETEFIYPYDSDSVTIENIAIRELMAQTGESRANFWVSGLIKR